MQVRKQQLELDMEQQTGSKSEKEYAKAVYCHPAYLTYMQSTSHEMSDWIKHKLESRLLGQIQQQICKWHHPYDRKQRRAKETLERGEWKGWLKIQHSENIQHSEKDHGIQSHHFMANRWGKNGNSDILKLSTKELMLLNCGVGEDSWESIELQGDPTSQSDTTE